MVYYKTRMVNHNSRLVDQLGNGNYDSLDFSIFTHDTRVVDRSTEKLRLLSLWTLAMVNHDQSLTMASEGDT